MNETLKGFNFRKLIEEYGHIRVPEIQRDYAEGRKTQKVVDIRKSFLASLMQVISGAKEKEHLDFVYGSVRDGAFEPLDGQQRLTTLFLLSWFFAPTECKDLIDDSGHSVFTYETRTTAKDFCNELVKHSASDLYKKFHDMKQGSKFSEVISSRVWFKWAWHYDPTVTSMLTVLDSITELIDDTSSPYAYTTDFYKNINNILFNRLNLEDMGLSDELYVKMNARGKILSDFDILKSTLEEEIQLQKIDGLETEIERDWRKDVDGKWIDYCWDKYTSEYLDLDKNQVEKVEIKYRQLLLRLIALQLCRKQDIINSQLWIACCNTYQRELDRIIPMYVEQLFNHRHSQNNSYEQTKAIQIDFSKIRDDFNSILYKDINDKWHDVTDLLTFGIEPDKSNISLMDLFLEPSFSRSTQVIFYAAIAFTRRFPAQDISGNEVIKEDFNNWIRFVRNTVLISNNNARIDKPYKSVEAMSKIDAMLDDFCQENTTMLDYLVNVSDGKQFTKERVEEERVKAELRHDNKWNELILRAESQPMLWGQICSLLDWAKNESGEYNINEFETYLQYLEIILNESEHLDMNEVYKGLLCVRDYRYDNCLLKYSRERDRSWKRYLRESNGTYAPILKEVIDIWRQEIPSITTFKGCVDYLYNSRKEGIKDWRRFVIARPEMLSYAYDKMIFKNAGHYYVAQLKTMDSHCREIVLDYVERMLSEFVKVEFHDSKDNNDRNSITWNEYKLQAIENGVYRFTYNDNELLKTSDYDDLLAEINKQVLQYKIC